MQWLIQLCSNNSKTFKIDEKLTLLQKKLHRPLEESNDTYHSILCKKIDKA